MQRNILNTKFVKRDKAILTGLYLSKFDEKGLKALGFEGFNQAFNALGYSIGTKPASIKNYRDEFDPYFDNARKGWHKRAIREYCKEFRDKFSSLDFTTFTEMVISFVIKNYEVERIVAKKDRSESVAKRLITGNAAEEYFKAKYRLIDDFKNYRLKDTTNMACGFDFKLSSESNYYCIEVKGLSTNSGSIALTEKEFCAADNIGKRYCLFVVFNFNAVPFHRFFFDPLKSRLSFKKVERQITQISYTTTL